MTQAQESDLAELGFRLAPRKVLVNELPAYLKSKAILQTTSEEVKAPPSMPSLPPQPPASTAQPSPPPQLPANLPPAPSKNDAADNQTGVLRRTAPRLSHDRTRPAATTPSPTKVQRANTMIFTAQPREAVRPLKEYAPEDLTRYALRSLPAPLPLIPTARR